MNNKKIIEILCEVLAIVCNTFPNMKSFINNNLICFTEEVLVDEVFFICFKVLS